MVKYLPKLGLKEKDWQEVRQLIAPQDAQRGKGSNQEMRVDTHNTASHKSADESHVKAFEIFTKAVAPEAQLTFFEQDTKLI